jgi:hypothetical protein
MIKKLIGFKFNKLFAFYLIFRITEHIKYLDLYSSRYEFRIFIVELYPNSYNSSAWVRLKIS